MIGREKDMSRAADGAESDVLCLGNLCKEV